LPQAISNEPPILSTLNRKEEKKRGRLFSRTSRIKEKKRRGDARVFGEGRKVTSMKACPRHQEGEGRGTTTEKRKGGGVLVEKKIAPEPPAPQNKREKKKGGRRYLPLEFYSEKEKRGKGILKRKKIRATSPMSASGVGQEKKKKRRAARII